MLNDDQLDSVMYLMAIFFLLPDPSLELLNLDLLLSQLGQNGRKHGGDSLEIVGDPILVHLEERRSVDAAQLPIEGIH